MLILKQNAANSVPTPPSGKGTIFLDDSDVLSVKTSDGNVETFPTVAAANSQVVFINGTALSGESALTYDFNTNVLNVTGNIAVGNLLSDNLLYANGQPWDLSDPGGSNTQIQFNDDESFGGSAAFTFNKTTNVVSVTNVLLAGADASTSDFANTTVIISKGNTGATDSSKQAVVGEALAASTDAIGIQGIGKTAGTYKGTGVQGTAKVTNTADTGAAVGLRGYATDTHSGGYNIGVLGNAVGSGLGNYAFYVQSGNIGSIETDTAWDLNDNSASALSFNSSGKAGIIAVSTLDGTEGVSMSGTLAVTGNASAGNLSTIGAVAATGNVSGGNLSSAGALTVTGNANVGNLSTGGAVSAVGNVTAAYFIGNGSQLTGIDATAIQNGTSNVRTFLNANVAVSAGGTANVVLVTSTGANIAGTLNATGNANVGNLGTAGLITATGNVSGGNLTTAGAVAATGNVSGGNLSTGGALSVTGNANVGNIGATSGIFTANITGGNLSTGGALSVTGNANVGNLGTAGLITATGNVSGGNLTTGGALSVTGNANVGNIGAAAGVFTGNISASNANLGNLIIANVANLVDLNVSGSANIGGGSGGNISGANNITANTFTGTLTTAAQPNITSVGTLATLSVTGNANVGNVGATNGVFTNVSGNGAALTALTGANVNGQVANALVAGTVYTAAQPNITSVGTLTSLSVTGNASAGNVNAGNLLTANFVAGTLTTAAQPNITSVGTLSSLSVTGNVAAGNLTTTGVLSVTGTGVSSIAGNLDMTSNTIINLANPTNDQDAATKAYVDSIAQGLHVHASVSAATPDTLANISSGTVTYNNGTSGVGATLTTTGSYTTIDGVNIASVGTRVLVKNEANAAHNGIYVYSSGTVLTRATDFDTSTEMAGGDFFFVTSGTLYNDTGWVLTDPVTTVGTTDANFTQFSGAGTYTAGTGLTLTGSQFSVNASQTQVTALGNVTTGTWNSLVGSSATFAAGLSGANLASITGANVTGTVGSATTAGTVTTAAQPNITSVGTLTSLGVNGTVTAVAFTANTGVFTGNGSGLSAIAGGNVTGQVGNALVAGTVYTAAQPNITSVGTLTSLSVTGNANVGNIGAAAGVFTTVSGNGAALTALNASNISSGTLAQARLANSSLTVNGTSISLGDSGTITANTTQTLTLGTYLTGTSFNGGTAVTAAVDATDAATGSKVVARDVNGSFAGNVITATSFSGSGASLTSLNASNISSGTLPSARLSGSYSISVDSATTAGTVTTAAQPNITSVGTLTSLAVTGNVSAGNLTSTGTVGGTGATHLGNVLTTGANSTAGTITGNWTLSAGSRWNATYADLAEKYVADAHYEPGTVLVFGGEHEVTLANEFDSTRVAGVVTTDPAFSMNSACAGEHVAEIALQGRVPCKVHGPVAKGDLMVAGQNGHAVANNMARAGTIIGKSLENFEGGSGVIEVAVGRF